MADVAVTALGADRPGIVATIAEVLRDHGSNVTRATMTTLAGHVAVVLQVDTDDELEDLQDALEAAAEELDLTVSVDPAAAHGEATPATHLLSVYGTDQQGLLARVTRALADCGATIIDLVSQLVVDSGTTTWAMSAELVAPRDHDRLAADLAAACDELGVEHSLTALDLD